jgi:hypothetical protein
MPDTVDPSHHKRVSSSDAGRCSVMAHAEVKVEPFGDHDRVSRRDRDLRSAVAFLTTFLPTQTTHRSAGAADRHTKEQAWGD